MWGTSDTERDKSNPAKVPQELEHRQWNGDLQRHKSPEQTFRIVEHLLLCTDSTVISDSKMRKNQY